MQRFCDFSRYDYFSRKKCLQKKALVASAVKELLWVRDSRVGYFVLKTNISCCDLIGFFSEKSFLPNPTGMVCSSERVRDSKVFQKGDSVVVFLIAKTAFAHLLPSLTRGFCCDPQLLLAGPAGKGKCTVS